MRVLESKKQKREIARAPRPPRLPPPLPATFQSTNQPINVILSSHSFPIAFTQTRHHHHQLSFLISKREYRSAINDEDVYGSTPMDDAIRMGHESVVALLKSHGVVSKQVGETGGL